MSDGERWWIRGWRDGGRWAAEMGDGLEEEELGLMCWQAVGMGDGLESTG